MNSNEIPKSVMNLAKRLHSMARQYDGRIIVNVTFLTNSEGVPVAWGKPKIIPLEPRLEADLLETELNQDQLQAFLEAIVFWS